MTRISVNPEQLAYRYFWRHTLLSPAQHKGRELAIQH